MRKSVLDSASERFLSLCLEQAFEESWLSPQDFITAFSPQVLMESLENVETIRSRLLVQAAGVHERVAPKKSTAAASEDLSLALEEGLCTPADICGLLSFDEQVRHLDTSALWTLLVQDSFYQSDNERGRKRMLFMLEAALEESLVDPARILQAITPERVAQALPRELLEEALCLALHNGLEAMPLGPDALVTALPLSIWLEHLTLAEVFDVVILGEIVSATSWLGSMPARAGQKSELAKEPASSAQSARTALAFAATAPAKPAATAAAKSLTPPDETTKPSVADTATDAPDVSADDSISVEIEEAPRSVTIAATPAPPTAEASTPEETKARKHAIAQLTQRGRLPARAAQLATPLLLAIEAMYVDLDGVSDEEEQAECIRDAFPNQSMLEDALLALAETLDARVSAEELKSRGVDVVGLIQLIIFEERKRRHSLERGGAAGTTNKSSVPPPPQSVVAPKASTAPPPLPAPARRASTPPPPLPAQARPRR